MTLAPSHAAPASPKNVDPSTAGPSATSMAARIAILPHLSLSDLWRVWDEHFDARPDHHHRTWLETRLAYRIQERAYGGLKPALRKKLQDIGATGLLPRQLQAKNGLLPGTILTRAYDGVEHRVVVHGGKDFEYLGQRFKSLSAVAGRITGTHLSGPAFFGLAGSAGQGGKKERA